jgi:hypothetical protein
MATKFYNFKTISGDCEQCGAHWRMKGGTTAGGTRPTFLERNRNCASGASMQSSGGSIAIGAEDVEYGCVVNCRNLAGFSRCLTARIV